MTSGGVTIGDLILAHVAKHTPDLNGETAYYTLPFDLSQDGISLAIGKSRAHVALEVKKLVARGLVLEQNAHITGTNGKRRKAYAITPEGRRSVSDTAMVALERIEPMDRLKVAIGDMELRVMALETNLSNMKSSLAALREKVSA